MANVDFDPIADREHNRRVLANWCCLVILWVASWAAILLTAYFFFWSHK
jgi:hypothetical protein